MKILPRSKIPKFILPLPIYSSVHIADAVDRNGEEYDVFVGLDKKYVQQLKDLSSDVSDIDLQNNTGDPRRFGQGSYEDWYKKNRTPFCLIHKRTDALAALIFFGPKSLGKKSIKFGEDQADKKQNEWHTMAVRSYPNFRGKGMMQIFTQFVVNVYQGYFPQAMIWLGMDDRNAPMLRLAESLGFHMNAEHSDLAEHWLIMTSER